MKRRIIKRECMKRRILSVLACFVLAVAIILPVSVTSGQSASAQKAELKPIDIYLLAGQSNAAGHTQVYNGNKTQEENAKNAQLVSDVFQNVLMAGVCEPTVSGGSSYKKLTLASCSPVTSGYGRSSNCIGPEYGMAKELNSKYSSSNKAVIFKYAAGGVTLCDDSGHSTYASVGNWYPRSLQEKGKQGPTSGALYNGMVSSFTSFCNDLKSNGYQPVVKGIAWHQGEHDRQRPDQYRPVIQAFISDLREDMTTATGIDCSQMFFAVGEISETFGSSGHSNNLAFIKMQNEIVSSKACMPSAIVEAGDLNITANGGSTVLGSDSGHFSVADSITLGQRFAQAFSAYAGKKYATISATDGGSFSISKNYFEAGEELTITVAPLVGYKITEFKVDGVDKMSELNDKGEYTFTATDNVEAEVNFTARKICKITVTGGKYDIRKTKTSREVYEGDTIFVTPAPEQGYEVASVKFNGIDMTLNPETGRYELENATEDGQIVLSFREIGSASGGGNGGGNGGGSSSDDGGCGSETITLALSMMLTMLAGAFVLKK